jgi:hypothetical protein
MNVRVHIDRLVLDGFDLSAADAPRVQAAVELELSRLIVDGGGDALRAGGVVPSVQGAQFAPKPGATPSQLGADIARSVHGGIARR